MCFKQTENLKLGVLNMITWINESKILTKHTSCECKYKFDARKCNSNPKWNNDKCWCKCKNKRRSIFCAKEIIFGILLNVVVKMVSI